MTTNVNASLCVAYRDACYSVNMWIYGITIVDSLPFRDYEFAENVALLLNYCIGCRDLWITIAYFCSALYKKKCMFS